MFKPIVRSLSFKTVLAIALATAWAPENHSYAHERFWELNQPEHFAHNFSQELINLFPRYSTEQCMGDLMATGKNAVLRRRKFKEDFMKSTSAITLTQNTLTTKLMNEYHDLQDMIRDRDKKRESGEFKERIEAKRKQKLGKILLPQYFSWLSGLANSFYNLRNYEGIISANAAPAFHVSFLPKSRQNLAEGEAEYSYEPGKLGPTEPSLLYFLKNFTRMVSIQALQKKHISQELPFFPATPSLSQAVDRITSKDYEGPGIVSNREEVAAMICGSLDYRNLRAYAETPRFKFKTPEWIHHFHPEAVEPEEGEIPVKVSSSEERDQDEDSDDENSLQISTKNK